MAERRVLVCDIDEAGGAITYVVTFSGETYAIDLCPEHAEAILELLPHATKRAPRGPRKRTAKVAAVPRGVERA